jgi:hypothetical protein
MLHNPVLGDVVFVEKYTSLWYFVLVISNVSKFPSADQRRSVTGTFCDIVALKCMGCCSCFYGDGVVFQLRLYTEQQRL